MLRYGRQFQKHRRLLEEYLNKNQCVSYRPIQARETGLLLQTLLLDDEKRESAIRRYCTLAIEIPVFRSSCIYC